MGYLFARCDPWLFADHAVAADLLDIAVGIGDHPVPGEQLRRQAAEVADADRVGEHVAVVVGLRLFVEEPGRDLDFEGVRSEEHTSELQSLMRNSYAVFCLKTKKKIQL